MQVLTDFTGRPTGLMSEPLMAPPQLKPSPPLLHKEAPILIKQASLDKNKGSKKDKVCICTVHVMSLIMTGLLLFFFLVPIPNCMRYIREHSIKTSKLAMDQRVNNGVCGNISEYNL
jgi:hypothetical protein